MHSRGDNNPNNVSVTRKIGEIYMSSKITYMVRPISIYTEFLETEISHPKRCYQWHFHNRFLHNLESGISWDQRFITTGQGLDLV